LKINYFYASLVKINTRPSFLPTKSIKIFLSFFQFGASQPSSGCARWEIGISRKSRCFGDWRTVSCFVESKVSKCKCK